MDTTLDPSIVALARSIKKNETGVGDTYNSKTGPDGEQGAYRWVRGQKFDTWANGSKYYPGAKEILGDGNAPMTMDNQNKVAYAQVKAMKEKGFDPGQIASIWNSGSPDHVDGTHQGTSTGGAGYDTPKYVQRVYGDYQKFKGTGQSNLPQDDLPGVGSLPKVPATTFSQGPQDQHTGILGTNPNDSTYGKIIDNSLTRDIVGLVPGAKDLGEGIGAYTQKNVEKIKGLLGGRDNSKYIDTPSIGKTALGGLKVGGDIAAVISGGALAQGLLDATAVSETGPVTSYISKSLKMDPTNVARYLKLAKAYLVGKIALNTLGPEAQKVLGSLTDLIK